jgi:hypothetical protein
MFPMGSQCVPQVVNVFPQYVPNRTSLYPISFAKHCPLAKYWDLHLLCIHHKQFEKQKHVKKIFFPSKEM